MFVDGYALMALEEVAMTLAAPSAIGGVASTLFFGQRGINMLATAKSGSCSLRRLQGFLSDKGIYCQLSSFLALGLFAP